ncbi:MAG TPA: hypothetical protein VFC51_02880 [Chloroflexota bacterium]|nr:hypothetical protein [Chloroflexota bacterium]
MLLVALLAGLSPLGATAQAVSSQSLLVAQQVDQLPPGAACWTVNVNTGEVGGRAPEAGYHQHGLNLIYQSAGTQTVEFEDGHVFSEGAGGAFYLPPAVSHAHITVGDSTTETIIFALTCAPPLDLGVTRAERLQTEPLAGLAQASGPYRCELWRIQVVPGDALPEETGDVAVAAFVREGSVAVESEAGSEIHEAGDLFVVPPGTAYTLAAGREERAVLLLAVLTSVPAA